MKKLLLLSDSHGNGEALLRCMEKEQDADAVFFLGDGLHDLDMAMARRTHRVPVYFVAGNCDAGDYSREGLAVFEGFLILYTHGDRYGVQVTPTLLSEAARARGADMAFCGHTHIPAAWQTDDMPSVYNPGSVGQPRGPEGATYATLTLEKGQSPQYQVLPVPPLCRATL